MSTGARKILLIDDDRMQFRLAQAQFRKIRVEAYELDWAETYEEGLAKLLTGGYAACLLDYRLGDRDGLELIHEAVGQGCRTPIVFLTAETAKKVDFAAMNAGALDYLVKGEITPRTLERSLRYALKLGDTLEELRRLATRDQLTGLLNRREFDRILAEESERAVRFGRPLALILVDIDHFKRVNDTHGHPAGDGVLREVARRLGGLMRSVDRVTRFGGEEFALVVMEMDRLSALETAGRICLEIARTPIRTGDLVLPLTVSAGVAVLPGDANDGAGLVVAADKALYAAKESGRNRAMAFADL